MSKRSTSTEMVDFSGPPWLETIGAKLHSFLGTFYVC